MLRRKWRSSQTNKKNNRRKKWLIILLIVVLLFTQMIIYVDRNLKHPLMNLAKVKLRQIAAETINAAVTDRITQATDAERLIDWRLNKEDKVTGWSLNYSELMRITKDTINIVQPIMKELTSMPEHIPVGQAMGSPLIASFGPNIPIRLVPQGNVQVKLDTRYQNAGINTILVEVYIRVTAEVSVIIPFDSEPEIIESEIPILYSMVVGDVPMYYFDNKGNPTGQNKDVVPPNISVPNINSVPQTAPKKEGSHETTPKG
ncbi:sporulation protein YunB [Paenibacillus sp. N1-5-1-14]|uniref:sporulation protein YunB n=1 Tax=Paenibacillus radicibacter TaxID=2972488 RepID=UPI002159116D|nr:sporulation protein YunB [Paenibacillus radicibacter]MCR8645329.1 sporulation protein YunB [Paenibacillus radicibacter]